MLSSVVLPQPEGPSTAISSPGFRCSEMSSRAWTSPPFGKVKTIETLSMTSPSNAPSPLRVRNDGTLTAARRLRDWRGALPAVP